MLGSLGGRYLGGGAVLQTVRAQCACKQDCEHRYF